MKKMHCLRSESYIGRKPWVGDFYDTEGLLLIAESNYWSSDRSDDPDITIEVVKLITSEARYLPHFTKIERAITGCDRWQNNPKMFWQTVAYANFCQGACPDAETRPTPEMWASGIKTFPFLLGMLKPRKMIVFSFGIRDRCSKLDGLDWEARTGDPIMHEGEELETGYLFEKAGIVRIHCLFIPHTASFGWGDPSRWHSAIKQFRDKPLQRHSCRVHGHRLAATVRP